MIWLCHLEVDSFSQRCPVVALEPEAPLEGLTFDDFSRTPYLLGRAKAGRKTLSRVTPESFSGASLEGS